MKYEPVIGLEIHVELNTKSKMFCKCSANYFGAKPNTHTCPICLGLPGALPYINKQAVEDTIKIGLSLGCVISKNSLFERKNYFYPDLPKGYQISQYRWPLCKNGNLDRIRINRVHLEEDTGKLLHLVGETVIDFNRSGVPLVEVVTEPDFKNSEEVKEFARKLQQLFRSLGVSKADMERGDMRLEANVSVRPKGQTKLPDYRVELKNINSFNFMADAIEYEITRQIEVLENGEKITQHTRGWNQNRRETFVQREKEEANDYRYFPDPDLPRLEISKDEVEKLKSGLPELPWARVGRMAEAYGLSESDVKVINKSPEMEELFLKSLEISHEKGINPKQIISLIINRKLDIKNTTPEELINKIVSKGSDLVSDYSQLQDWTNEVISENPDLVDKYKSGKTNVIMALIGAVMKKSLGKADSIKVRRILETSLQKFE